MQGRFSIYRTSQFRTYVHDDMQLVTGEGTFSCSVVSKLNILAVSID